MKYLIGVDVGTTATKAVLYDEKIRIIKQFQQGYHLYRDAAGKAEQAPQDIVHAVEKVIHDAADLLNFDQDQLLAVSFSSANQSLIPLDSQFHPVTRVLTWADTRSRPLAYQLKHSSLGQQIYVKTGTPIHSMSPLTKIMWLKEEQPAKFNQIKYYADIKSYLFYQFFNTFKIDISIASCTGLMNVHTGKWDSLALQTAGIDVGQLPEIVDGTDQATGLTARAQEKLGIPADTPFIYGAFDGALSNLGVGAIKKDTVAITIGTSAGVRVITDHPVIDPQQRLFCYAVVKGVWVVGGPLNNGGDIYQWAVKNLVDTSAVKKANPYALANNVIETVPAGAHGLLFHPFLGGERAPLWNSDARGSFFGLSQIHTRADMLRAVMEGICMNIATVFHAVCDLIGQPTKVTATGGFARSEVWRQMLTDVLDCPVEIPQAFESGCLGATIMAIKSLGMVDSLSVVKKFIGKVNSYQPDSKATQTYHELQPLFEEVTRLLSPAYSRVAALQKKL